LGTVSPFRTFGAFEAFEAAPPLVAVAHGSRDPRSAATVAALVDLVRRLAAAGVALDDPGLGVVLAAAGSAHPPANAAVEAVAAGWSTRAPWVGARAAFAAACAPSVSSAVTALMAHGARRIAVASWFLAPGRLPDRVAHAARAADPGVLMAEPLGADPEVAQVVLERYAATLGESSRAAIAAAAGPSCGGVRPG
jgi:sirohydrochlorin ferrochelatase